MDEANFWLGICNISVGIFIILISIPLVLGKIPMNQWYGIRFSKSFVSEQNWYMINAYGGKQLIVWSVPLILFGGLTFFLPIGTDPLWVILVACAPLIVIVPAIMSYNYSKKITRVEPSSAVDG